MPGRGKCGDDGLKDTPVPMPNTEVKLQHAKSSWGIAPCEDRTLPRDYGGLAQLGEHLPYKQEVTGSSPVSSICGCGGIGRRARFRILYLLDVRVQVPSSAFGIKTLFQNHIDIGL